MPGGEPALLEVFDVLGRRMNTRDLPASAPGTIQVHLFRRLTPTPSHGETAEQATLLDADGKLPWRKVCDHFQFALIGRFRPDLPGKRASFVDRQIHRYPPEKHEGEVFLYTKAGG